ncbi:MAG: ABC transporter permease [Mycoplasma sp.]|nr:ABC transporter permease [Mycoplasma sp.]
MIKHTKKMYQEFATIQLINRHFWKSKIGPLSSLCIPLFLMIIYKVVGRNGISIESGLPSFLAFSILPLCLISLPQMIVEFKTSIILRKISISKITSWKFSLLVLSYNLLAVLCSTLVIFLLFTIFLNVDAANYYKTVNWGELIYVLLNIYVSCLSFGLLLGVLINKINLVQIIAFIFIIVSITFSGQLIPMSVLSRSEAIRYVALFSPLSYSLNMMNIVLTDNGKEVIESLYSLSLLPEGSEAIKFTQVAKDTYINEVVPYNFSGIFNVSKPYLSFSFKYHDISPQFAYYVEIISEDTISGLLESPIQVDSIKVTTVYKSWQLIMNLLMPYIVSGIFIFVSIKKFKWTSR